MTSLANLCVERALRSPLHGALDGSLTLLTYRGMRSGREITLPVQYARDGDQVVVLVGHPERKRWWRNFRGPREVRLRLDGRDWTGRGRLTADAWSREVYARRFPHAGRAARAPDALLLRVSGLHPA